MSHPANTVVEMALAHHTKSKGDLGVAKVHADLVEQGLLVLFPHTEHAPFDLVAYDGTDFLRIQVKFRAAYRGAVTVVLRSVWADRNGTHTTPFDLDQIDLVAIYCPDTDACYYVRADDCGRSVTLRIATPRNSQATGVRLANGFRTIRPRGAGV